MQNKELLQKLAQKLKTGNLRSIHLNALPGRYATRLDISQLNKINEGLAEQFLYDHIFQKPAFRFQISFSKLDLNILEPEEKHGLYTIAKKLDSIDYQNTDSFLEHGIKNFGFGFPLLIMRDPNSPDRIIKAPLLIWNLEIEKSHRIQNTWGIIRDEDFPVAVNEVLISYLSNSLSLNINELNEKFINEGFVNKNDLLQICHELLSKLGVQFDIQNFRTDLSKCPDSKMIGSITPTKPWIHWTGIFGIYKTQKESIIKDIEYCIENIKSFQFENLQVEKYQTSTISSVETDPSQEEIVNSLSNSSSIIIQGPPGTGKSQSLTAIITNALDNQAKCLVVCEKKTALDVIHSNLVNLGLENLCIVIDDVAKDRKKIIDRVRSRCDHNTIYFREQEYRQDCKDYESLKAELNKKYKSVLTKINGDDNWKDIIGKYLTNERINSKNILENKIDSSQINGSFEEFHRISKNIKEGYNLFRLINTLDNPLQLLSNSVFEKEYSTTTRKHLFNDLKNRQQICKEILAELKKSCNNYGPSFYNRNFWNNLISTFLAIILQRYKKLKYIKREMDARLKHLSECHFISNNVNFEFPAISKKWSYIQIYERLTIYFTKLNRIVKSFETFEAFYQWKYFIKNIPQFDLNIINTLIEANTNKWQNAFRSWYYNSLLEKFESETGPFLTNDQLLLDFNNLSDKLCNNQKNKIIRKWHIIQENAVHNYSRKNGSINILYNYRKNNKYARKNSLRKIIASDFTLFTSFFPVVLVNPVVCSSILPLKEGLFDLVVFDEASQLRLEDTYTAFLRGKNKIISGDKHQMPPSDYFTGSVSIEIEDDDNELMPATTFADSASLLEFAETKDYSCSNLDFHYRSRHPSLIEFSNASFYGSRLVPMPAKTEYRPIRLINSNGLYENRTNLKEAKDIVSFLFNSIGQSHTGKYHSVGIATLNIDQRNLILDIIHSYCEKNIKFAEKYEMMCKSGFFVKNLENIQGDEKDIIIISTTFGNNNNGKFHERFGPLNNREKGYKLLNVIVTRAKKALFIFTSIPKEYYLNFSNEINSFGNRGKGIFYAFLAYAQAVENQNKEKQKNILRILAEHCETPKVSPEKKFVESPFEQEVYEHLLEYIEKDRIEIQYKCGGFRIDFVIHPKNGGQPKIAIECDGASYHSSEVAYAYDMFRQKQLEKIGFKVYRIWSTNWWQDSKREIIKLIQFIDKNDSEPKKSSNGIKIEPTLL